MIEFKNVTKVYGDSGTKALQDVSIRIDEGEFVFIVGSSGAGKSTFLKLIMREEVPTSGTIVVNGINLNDIKLKKIPYFRRSIGVVFQDFRLIPTLNVFDNVAYAMRVVGSRESDIRKRVPYLLGLVGLASKAKSLPTQLSGGEQQRVALARALANDAQLIIADEPTGNIDPEMSYEIVDLLNHINAEGKTVVMVTHEHSLVKRFNHRVIKIEHGAIVADGDDATVLTSAPPTEQTERAGTYYSDPHKTNDLDFDELIKVYGLEKDLGKADKQQAEANDGPENAVSEGLSQTDIPVEAPQQGETPPVPDAYSQPEPISPETDGKAGDE